MTLRRRSQRVGSVAGRDKCPRNGKPAGATLRIGRPLASRRPILPGHGRRPFAVRQGPAAPGRRESPGDLQRRVPHLVRAHERARTGGGRILGAGPDAPDGQRNAPPGAHLDLVAPRFVRPIALRREPSWPPSSTSCGGPDPPWCRVWWSTGAEPSRSFARWAPSKHTWPSTASSTRDASLSLPRPPRSIPGRSAPSCSGTHGRPGPATRRCSTISSTAGSRSPRSPTTADRHGSVGLVIACSDPDEEVRVITRRLLEAVEDGVPLWRQAIIHPPLDRYRRIVSPAAHRRPASRARGPRR